MIYYYDIICIIIVLTLIIIILYKNYYISNIDDSFYTETKSEHAQEPFLVLPDSSLYTSNTDKINNKPVNKKYQIPVAVNQLNEQQLHNIDSNILRQNRILKTFSMTDELDVYQMYNILKQMKNKIYTFSYDANSIDINKKAKIIESEKIISLNSGAINNVDLELFTRIKLEIISAFNNFIIKSGYYTNYHPYHFFKIINSNLISFNKKNTNPNTTNPNTTNPNTTNPNTTNPNTTNPSGTTEYNWCMSLTFGREYKFQQFIIYYDIDMQIINNTNYIIKLNKVEIEGIPMPNTVKFHSNQKTKSNQSPNIQTELDKVTEENENNNNNDYYYKDQVKSDSTDSSFDIMSFGENSKLFQSQDLKFIDPIERSDLDLTLFDTNSIKSKINNKIMNISKDTYFNNHKCFGLVNGVSQELPEYKNPIFCKSYHPEINQNGVWDAPCQVDKDCPFYNANKNYPNEYGKCDVKSGSCEMPLGIIPIGFTKYGKVEPNCYNCSITSKDSKCCGAQMQDIKEKKVNYLSPDYIFSNDENIRKQYKTNLESLGLNVMPSI